MSLLRTLCKFRISLHSFNVNLIRRSKGKYLVGTDYSNCSSGGIENEFHLLSVLDKYKDLRNAYLGPPLENSVICKQLMKSENIATIHSLALFSNFYLAL